MLRGLGVAFNLASTAANITKVSPGAVAPFAATDRAAVDEPFFTAFAKLAAGRSLTSTLRAQKPIRHRLSQRADGPSGSAHPLTRRSSMSLATSSQILASSRNSLFV